MNSSWYILNRVEYSFTESEHRNTESKLGPSLLILDFLTRSLPLHTYCILVNELTAQHRSWLLALVSDRL